MANRSNRPTRQAGATGGGDQPAGTAIEGGPKRKEGLLRLLVLLSTPTGPVPTPAAVHGS